MSRPNGVAPPAALREKAEIALRPRSPLLAVDLDERRSLAERRSPVGSLTTVCAHLALGAATHHAFVATAR